MKTTNVYQITQHGKPRWVCEVYVDGKQKRFYPKENTMVAARALYQEKLERLTNGQPLSDTRQTVAAWLDEWYETYLRHGGIKPTTLSFYDRYIRVHLKPAFGDTPLAKLTPLMIQSWINTAKQKFAGNTVRHAFKTLHRALEQAVINGLITSDPSKKGRVRLGKFAKPKYTPMTEAEERKFFAVADSETLTVRRVKNGKIEVFEQAVPNGMATFYRVVLMLGLRKGEALGLQWSDVDWDNKKIHVRRSLVDYKLDGEHVREFSSTKTAGSERTLILWGNLVELLRAHRAKQLQLKMRNRTRWQDGDLIFCTGIGTPIGPSNVSRHFRMVLKRAGLQGHKLHGMRHLAATKMLEADIDLKTVSEILGHSQISITADLYGHIRDRKLQDAAAKMEKASGF